MAIELPRITIGDKEYFVDMRLKQLRNVNNPNDFINCEKAGIEGTMVCLVEMLWTGKGKKPIVYELGKEV